VPILVNCDCGKALRAKEELAGKKVRCPACSKVMKLPIPEATLEDDAASMLLADLDPSEKKPAVNYSTSYRGEKQVPPPLPPTRAISAKPTPLPPPRLEAKKKKMTRGKKREGYSGIAFEKGWFGDVNSGAIGGILMMVIAVVWFVLGWLGGVLFIYPPILFVLGFIAFIKGLFGGD
jgi:hypothetical protein